MEITKLKCLINEFSNTKSGDFLNTFHWKEIQIKKMNFRIEGVVTAMYCTLTDTIKVAPDRADDVFFGSVIHELMHAAQRHASGLLLYLLIKTFLRSKLEEEAKTAELSATQWIGEKRIEEWRKQHDNI